MLNKQRIMAATEPRRAVPTPFESMPGVGVLDRQSFRRMLYLEQRRTERSRRRFVLMLLESESLLTAGENEETFDQIVEALSRSTRETDVTGWYETGSVIGIIFTEIGPSEGRSVASAILAKVSAALTSTLSIEQINQISISFHVFPEDWSGTGNGSSSSSQGPALRLESGVNGGPKKASLAVKRGIDIAGSALALILLSPVFLAIAVAIKLTSRGPILFRQRRVGQYGEPFTFLKFRSMRCETDPSIHEEFIAQFIAGEAGASDSHSQRQNVFKITKDPRLTSIGGFLRRSSLDELPQFFNVLIGEMSLVGPRPPIPYEVARYDIWHKRRFLAVKPGITGLWQVTGRSRVTFDEMVRLDLKYARTWSLWLDIKILIQTPRAVLGGAGAY
jgi:exopolysaccharide biosynthesis polyprenyl glycosylphosphotransferase